MAHRGRGELQAGHLGGVLEQLAQAMTEARKATEDLPPLEELAALQEAMAGLAQMGAVMGRMRAASQRDEESVELSLIHI